MAYLKQINVKQGLILGALLLVTLLVVLPFFRNGYFPTHDGEWAVVRLSDMFRTIKDLQIPARFSGNLNFGYGYPLFNFAYPFPYYAGLLFVFLKLGFVGSIKTLFIISVLSGSLGMYFLSKSVWRSTLSGFVSAILYTYLPYKLVDLYVRGSLGESMAFGIFPWILFFISRTFSKKNGTLNILISGLLYAVLITTHNITAVLFTPVLVLFSLGIWMEKKKNLISLLYVFFIGYGLSAFFWIPALLEKQNIWLSKFPIADRNLYFVKPLKLLFSPFGYGTPTGNDPFTYQIGIPHILLGLLVLVFVIWKYVMKKKDQHAGFVFLLLFLMTGMILMLFSQSGIIWENTPLLSEINYPWILLSQIGLVICLLVGYLMIQSRVFRYIAFGLTAIAVILYFPSAKPKEYVNRGDMFYITNDATTTSSDELMPLWVTQKPHERSAEKVMVVLGTGEIKNLTSLSHRLTFESTLQSEGVVRVNTIYYPGWEARVNERVIPISYDNPMGVMELSLPKGTHNVTLRFKETPERLLANTISLVTTFVVFLVFGIYVFSLRKGKRT